MMKLLRLGLLILSVFSIQVATAAPQDKDAIERGTILVENRCSFCHKKTSLLELTQHSISRKGTEHLYKFFKRHHAPDEQACSDIISYLTSIIDEQ